MGLIAQSPIFMHAIYTTYHKTVLSKDLRTLQRSAQMFKGDWHKFKEDGLQLYRFSQIVQKKSFNCQNHYCFHQCLTGKIGLVPPYDLIKFRTYYFVRFVSSNIFKNIPLKYIQKTLSNGFRKNILIKFSNNNTLCHTMSMR